MAVLESTGPKAAAEATARHLTGAAGKAGRRCDDACHRQHCRKNAFHDRYSSFCAAPRDPSCNHPLTTTFHLHCFALTRLALIRKSNRVMCYRIPLGQKIETNSSAPGLAWPFQGGDPVIADSAECLATVSPESARRRSAE
jgi:hypothetical protein